MKWTDVVGIDFHSEAKPLETGWWIPPGTATKNDQAHRVPLLPRVVTLLRAAAAAGPRDNRWVLGGIKGGSVGARGVKSLPFVQRRDSYVGDTVAAEEGSRRSR